MTTEKMTNTPHPQGEELWSSVFDMPEVASMRRQSGIMLRALQVERDDILTAKLPTTVQFHKSVEDGIFPVLPNSIGGLSAVLGIFEVLATFDNLARSRFGSVSSPGFWVRNPKVRTEVTPAIPVSGAAHLCGIKPYMLRSSLVPLVKDKAVEFIRSPSGVAAVMVNPGFVNNHKFRKFFQI